MVYYCFNQITGNILITIMIIIIITMNMIATIITTIITMFSAITTIITTMIIIGDLQPMEGDYCIMEGDYCISGIVRRYYWGYLFGWLLLLVACGDCNRNTTNGIMWKTQQ